MLSRASISRSSFSLPFGWSSSRRSSVDLPPVQLHSIETAAEKRPRTLKHLLKANHANHALIYHNLQFHNHCSHILGSAYLLGATPEQLTAIYEEESKSLEAWRDAPAEVTKEDWRDFLGEKEYQRAFVDFFEDRLVHHMYDWKKLMNEYLFGGKEPLINNILSGLGHSVIHLGYAYELQSQTLAIEALTTSSCFYNFMHKYLNDQFYTRPAAETAFTPLDLIDKIAVDKRFDHFIDCPGDDHNIERLFEKHEDAVLEYWNSWDLHDPNGQFEKSQEAAVALLVGSRKDNAQFDFFLVHLLTSSHAIRILLPLIPDQWHVSLVRQWWLLAIALYVTQGRPAVDTDRITEYDLQDRDWKYVVDAALNGPGATDAHFVKACRAMKVAAETWGDDTQFYLKAAVRFASEFDSWGGFGLAHDNDDVTQPAGDQR